jgi:hypothetical protein
MWQLLEFIRTNPTATTTDARKALEFPDEKPVRLATHRLVAIGQLPEGWKWPRPTATRQAAQHSAPEGNCMLCGQGTFRHATTCALVRARVDSLRG